MINTILRYFKGNIKFRAFNGFCERLINLCASNNIELWDFEKTDDGFCAVVTTKSYKLLQKLAKRANVEINTISRRGFLYKAGKYRKRWGLLLGICAFLGFLYCMQSFVWRIEITGNETVKTEVIMAELKELGVTRFAYIPSMDFRQKKQQALLRLPQLSWVAINREGNTLNVQVTERKIKPEIADKSPCDIVAAKTGLILYMEVYSGTKLVYEKHTVREGEILVSGEVNRQVDEQKPQKGKSMLVHADAKVIAQTQMKKSLSVSISQLSKAYTGKVTKRNYLTVFSLKLPLFLATKQEGLYESTVKEEILYLFGIKTPFGISSVEYKFYEEKPEKLSVKDARKVLNDCFLKYQTTELKDAVIVSKTPHEQLKGDILTITMDYVLEENIAQKSPRR